MTQRSYTHLILILGSLTALGPFSIDMYLPGFIAIAKDLNTSVSQVSLSLSSYFIGISAGQLLYGPLLDKYGRKKPLYIGLSLYILASIGCLLIHQIEALIILRFIQAIGSCAAAVASIAMVRDLFPVKENAKVFALLMLVLGVSPMLAPTAGGYLTAAFGWQSIFIALTIMGALILLASYLWLPESYEPDRSISLKPKPIISNFWNVLREPQFYTYALTGAVSFSGLFAYVAGSPVVFMGIYGLSDKAYGGIFALLSVGLIGSSNLNSLLLKKYKSEQVVLVAVITQTFIALAFLFASINGLLDMTGTIVMLFLFLSCLGFANPNASALSLAPFSKNAGSASSLMGALTMGLGALASVAVSVFDTHSAIPMVAIMAGSSIAALGILLLGRKNITNYSTDEGKPLIIH